MSYPFIHPVETLHQAIRFLTGDEEIPPFSVDKEAIFDQAAKYPVDFAEVKGQAHVKRALAMLTELPERALILLDELGTATDPTEGGALALALLRAFLRRGAWGAATTHLPLLKNFAAKETGFANVAVIFDDSTRRPTYRLAYGVAGASNALTIARELALSPEILAEAEGFLDSSWAPPGIQRPPSARCNARTAHVQGTFRQTDATVTGNHRAGDRGNP